MAEHKITEGLMMPKLTAGEKKWLKKVQAVYQNGTRSGDFCRAVEACDASFNECLIFKNPVESTSG
ncbi:hypothetical protein [Vibrio cholerae]|uniref:hypothetical protein n=1 Tax=Vibrio cholerae TaxID=666 RepID=UPI0011D88E81|nr:hypothetical protein [Vibrio cholerae]TXY52030.1 hypothetical protein FXE74_18755 [Vibrio cholerae]